MTTTEAESMQIGHLRLELEHKDQLLASVYARADTLQAVVDRLELALEAAIEAQREAATERSELRRLLGNAQLQVHALMQLPAPDANGEAPTMELPQRPGVASAGPPKAAQPAAAQPGSVQPRPAAARPRRPKPRIEPRGLVEEARGMLLGLRRMI